MHSIKDKNDLKPVARKGKPKIRVLIVFANPLNTNALRLGTEDRVIREAIKLSPYRSNISLTICHATTIHDLRRQLLTNRYQIVHISGHGVEEGLLLEDQTGRNHIVPRVALARLFQAYSPPIECILLNACYSISQGQLASLGVPYTIAMDGPIDDDAAIEFARGFYDSIGAGKDYDFAYEEGCRTVFLTVPNANFTSEILRKDNEPAKSTTSKEMNIYQQSYVNLVSLTYNLDGSTQLPENNTILSKPSKSSREKKEAADLFYYIGDYEQALALYEDAIQSFDIDAELYNSKGLVLEELKRYKEAIAAYQEAIQLDPDYPKAYQNLASSLVNSKRYEEAIATCLEAIQLDPDDVLTYHNLGAAYYHLNRCEEAIAAYQAAIQIDTNPLIYCNLGVALERLKRYDEALVAYQVAIQLDSKCMYAYLFSGETLCKLSRYDEALTNCEKAIHLDPTESVAYENKGDALNGLKRYEEAVLAYQEAIRLEPKRGQPYINLGNLLKQQELESD